MPVDGEPCVANRDPEIDSRKMPEIRQLPGLTSAPLAEFRSASDEFDRRVAGR